MAKPSLKLTLYGDFLHRCRAVVTTRLRRLIRDNTYIENRYSLYLPENVVIKFCKMVLGVNTSAVNSAVLMELGLLPLSLIALKLSTSIAAMGPNSLVRFGD